jgi:hypothetical protein
VGAHQADDDAAEDRGQERHHRQHQNTRAIRDSAQVDGSDNDQASQADREPVDVRTAIRKKWDSGALLAQYAAGQDWEALSIAIRGPSAREIGERPAEVRLWAAEWAEAARGPLRVEYKQVGGRHFGMNSVPGRALARRLRRCLGSAQGSARRPGYVRFRVPGEFRGFSELSARTEEFTAAPDGITRAYVIENEITYLAFPVYTAVEKAVATVGQNNR